MADALVLIITTGIGIVEIKAKSQFLTGVDGELGIQMVLAVLLVATVVVRQVGNGRQRAREVPFVGLLVHLVVGVQESEL